MIKKTFSINNRRMKMNKKVKIITGTLVASLALTGGMVFFNNAVNASEPNESNESFVIKDADYELSPENFEKVDFDKVEQKAASKKPEEYKDDYIGELSKQYKDQGYSVFDLETYTKEAGGPKLCYYENDVLYDFVVGFVADKDNTSEYAVKATPDQVNLFIDSEHMCGTDFYPDSNDGNVSIYRAKTWDGTVYTISYDNEKEVMIYIVNMENCTISYPEDGNGVG
jgi:hypothetical protein